MKKSIKKIALSILLALAAVVLCVFGSVSFRSDNSFTADAAAVTTTAVISTDKEMIGPGEEFTVTVKLTSSYTDAAWSSFSFVFGEIDEAGKGTDTNAQYLSLVSFTHNLDGKWIDTSSYMSTASSPARVGMNVGLSFDASSAVKAITNKPVEFKFTLKVSESAGSIGKLVFGIGSASSNKVNVIPNGGSSTPETFRNIKPNTVELKLGTVSKDATLHSIEVGHGTPSNSITISDEMAFVSASADKTNFKIKPTVDKSATMKYGVGASNPTPATDATSGSEITITLDDSGVTVVKFLITAEDGTTTKTYTLTITSSYARLSALTANLVRPSGAPTVTGIGLTGFDKDTFAYTVKVPSDCTAVELTPTILTGYGATGGSVTTSGGCSADASTLSNNGKISVTGIADGATVSLGVTAKDGTSQTYVLTFNVLNVNTDISSFTMTEDVTGTTVNNDSTKAPAGGYYFLLSEESGFQGTFNITLAESASTVKVDGAAYSSTTKYGAKTYSVVVTASAGNTKTYSVVVAKDVKAGDINDIKYQMASDAAAEVKTDAGITYDSATNTYTLTKNYDPADYASDKTFRVTGTPTAETTITATGMTGNGPWSKTLVNGKNEFSLKATSSVGSTTYKFVINLVEGKNSITDLVIKDKTGNAFTDFSFNSSQPEYFIEVPYKNFDYVILEATSDGALTTVVAEVGGKSAADFTRTSTSNLHTYGSAANTALKADAQTVIKVYGWADNKKGDKGTVYTLNITRKAADTSAKLDNLVLTIDGNVISEFDGGVYFDPDTTTYNYTIQPTGNPTATINIAASAQSDSATIAAGNADTKLDPNNITYTFPSTTNTKSYIIKVTSESGATTNYTINIKRVVAGGDFNNIEVSTDGSWFDSVLGSFTGTGSASSPKKHTVEYNISNAAVGSKFYVRVELNSLDAKAVSQTAGFTLNGDTFEGTLGKFGANTFKFAAQTGAGTTVYELTVNLKEELNGITDIQLKPSSGSIDDFTFNSYQDTYDIDVPYTVGSVTITVTPEGDYEFIYETGDKILKKVGTAYEKTSLALTMGATTTIVVYGKADNGTGEKGQEYTLNFKRAAADADTLLSDLVVTIDGQPVSFKEGAFDPGTTDYTVEINPDGNPSSVAVNIAATASSATATVTGDGNKTFTIRPNQESESKYTITVKAQSGATNTYNITVKRVIIAGDFETLEFAQTGSNYEDVKTSSYYDPQSQTYTLDLSLDDFKAGSKVSVRAIPTGGATVSTTPSLSGSNNVYSLTVNQGENTYAFTARSATGEQTYTFVINLFEGKNTIENIKLTADGKELASDLFAFSASKKDYEITVPSTVSSLEMTVTTDGSYCQVIDEANNAFAKSAIKTNHTRTITLQEGGTVVLVFRAVSDKGDDSDYYTFVIKRELPNSDTTLKKLEVTIGGKPYEFTEGAFDPDLLYYTIQVEEGMSVGVPKIIAEANAATSDVIGDGIQPSFQFNESTDTATYTVKVKAESGDERTYTITISQKPIILDSSYDLRDITITAPGYPNLFRGLPDYYNYPVSLTVDNKTTSANIVVTADNSKTQIVIETSPNEFSNGMLRLEEGDNTVRIYGIAEDGTNKGGIDYYEFIITRQKPAGAGPDTTITFGDDEFEFNINDDAPLVYVLEAYGYTKDKLDISVNLLNGGTYGVTKVEQGSEEAKNVITNANSGSTKKLSLDYGVNVFCVTVESADGRNSKSAVFVVERKIAALDGLGATEIPSLRNDFDPDVNEYTYNVNSNVTSINFDVDVDKDLLTYKIDGPSELSYGMNKYEITVYEKGSGRTASDAIRTITLNVFREKDNNFWFIMFWVLIALAIAELLIIIIVAATRKNKNAEEPAIIVTPSATPAAPAPQAQQQPIILQQPTQQGTIYIPPQDGQY